MYAEPAGDVGRGEGGGGVQELRDARGPPALPVVRQRGAAV
ncbi:hypothetical protein ACW7N6_37835 [Streptomyces sp. UC1A3]